MGDICEYDDFLDMNNIGLFWNMVKALFYILVNFYLDYYLRYERIFKENCKIIVLLIY